MPIAPGTSLGHYRVGEKLGQGGMGEVYRAEDTRLGRAVAIKVLPEAMASDAERLARFEREARSLAQLNHPNIAAIYGLEREGSIPFLALELVPGETLAERLGRGPVQAVEALGIARQIADALAEAHAAGILHRDLKPANVKLTPDGKVKVLDFGLAKSFLPDASGVDAGPSMSPTLTVGTQAGVLLGTAAYMAPEQARGHAVDRRADLWAFGVVLFELLTGRRTFDGGTISDTLASVLKEEPAWDALPADLPPAARRLLRRTLEKDPERRLRDVADARLEIDEALAEPVPEAAGAVVVAPAPRGGMATLLPWGVALLALAALVIVFVWGDGGRSGRVVKSSILPPPGADFHLASRQPGPVMISPDGTKVAFVARDDDRNVLLWVRSLDAEQAVPLPGTEGASYPFWSADSRHIGFFAEGKLKRVAAAGGPPLAIAEAPFGKGGSWSAEGKIVFAPSYNSEIHVVPANGGEAHPVTRLRSDRRENSHRFPDFLPDGRRFLFLARLSGNTEEPEGGQILVGDLEGGEPQPLVQTPAQAQRASGHLLFLRERVLLAQLFDEGRAELTGEPFVVAQDVQSLPGAARGVFSASQEGTLVYERSSGKAMYLLAWFDTDGRRLASVGDPGISSEVRLSPDGTRVAATFDDPQSSRQDVWVIDVERGIRQRVTSGGDSSGTPVWFPDGKRLVFRTRIGGQKDLYQKAADGSGDPALLLESDQDKTPTDISPDGRYLLYTVAAKDTGLDLWVLPLTGEDRTPRSFVASPTIDEAARFSPDGRWVAYETTEAARPEVYVTSFPTADARVRISRDGGEAPVWSRDGKQLFFIAPDDSLMSAAVAPGLAGLTAEPPVLVLAAALPTYGNYDVWGDRILMQAETLRHEGRSLTLVQSWPALREE